MAEKTRWEARRVKCPEEDRTAELLVEWRDHHGQPILHSISCDNPRFKGLEIWDCGWSCWQRVLRDDD